MRILFITATYSPSINGVASTLKLQKELLEKKGHQVTILAPKHPEQDQEKNIIRIPSLPNPYIPDYPILLPIPTLHNLKILNHKFDLIYFHHPFYIGKISLTLASHFKCPAIFFYHSRYEKAVQFHFPRFIFYPVLSFLVWRDIRNIAKRANHIIVGTTSIKQILRNHKIRIPISVIPSPRKSMGLGNFSKNKLRNKYSLPQDRLIILCVARLSKEKNLATLIKIISKIKPRSSYSLCFVGNGRELENLKKLAKKLKVIEKCIFLGSINYDSMPEIYSLADIFAYPCKVDTQALVIPEALSSGLPVVAFNSPGPKDFINHNQSGFLANNTNDFIRSLELLLDNSQIRQSMASQAQAGIKKNSADDSIKLIEEVFKKTIDAHKS